MNSSKKTIALFFTYGVSLSLWQKKGLLERELKLYTSLVKEGYSFLFLTYDRADVAFAPALKPFGITILPKKYHLPNWLYSFILPIAYRQELRACHIFKTNQMLGSWSAAIASLLYKKRLIVRTGYCLSTFARRVSYARYLVARLIEILALAVCDVLVVATAEEKKYFSAHTKKRVMQIPNYVDTDAFIPSSASKSGIKETTLLYVGRLSAQKNVGSLLSALTGLAGIKLRVVGSGELADKLKAQAMQNHLSVDWVGDLPHAALSNEMSSADIFILPSLYEGNPKVLIEAMATGASIVASDVAGINSVIRHGETGWLVPPTSAGLRQGIEHLLSRPELRAALGKSARAAAVQTYSLQNILHKEKALYE